MRSPAILLALILLGSAAHAADTLMLKCSSDFTNIFEIAIYKRPNGTYYRAETVQYEPAALIYEVTAEQVASRNFPLSDDRGEKRSLKHEGWGWMYRYENGSYNLALGCDGPWKRR